MLEDLDFADDIVLVSSKYEHIQNKTNRLVDNAGRLGLKLNAQKCKVMRRNTRREDKVMIRRKEVEDVEEFVYLGMTVTKEGGGTQDIKKRLRKARGAFFNLKNIWNTRSIGRNTKIKLFKTLVQPVLLYGCEALKLTVAEEKKLDRFQFTWLRRILRIWWPQRIRNDTISQVTGVKKIRDEMQHCAKKDVTWPGNPTIRARILREYLEIWEYGVHETRRVRHVSGTVFFPIRTFSEARKIRSPDTSMKRGMSRQPSMSNRLWLAMSKCKFYHPITTCSTVFMRIERSRNTRKNWHTFLHTDQYGPLSV